MITLVVGAYAPEIDQVRAPVAGGRAILLARAVGIGLVDAGLGTARALAEVKPDRLLLVGTAGLLPGAAQALDGVCVVEVARLAERAAVEYLPQPMVEAQSVRADPALVERCRQAGLPVASCVSSLGITRDADEAARLAKLGQLEHLECFAVLRAASRAGVPATAILAVANQVGPDAHAQWKRNRLRAEAAAQAALGRVLS